MEPVGRSVSAALRLPRRLWVAQGPVVRSFKASVRAEQSQSVCSQRVTTRGAAPLPVSLNPIFEARGFSARIRGVFLLLPSLPPRSSHGKGSSQSAGTLLSTSRSKQSAADLSLLRSFQLPCLALTSEKRGSSHLVDKFKALLA